MDYRYVVRILVAEDPRFWQELVAKELEEQPNFGLPKLNGIDGTTRAGRVMVGKTILSVSQEIERGTVRVDALGCVHKSPRRKLLQRVSWGTPLLSERSWWLLTIALAVLIGLLLVRLMQ